MSTVAEIKQAIPNLSNEALREVERALWQAYRDRKAGVIYDDAYGTFTEQDLPALREETLRIIDGESPKP